MAQSRTLALCWRVLAVLRPPAEGTLLDLPGVRDELLGDLVQAPAVLRAQVDLEGLPVEADRPSPRVLRATAKVTSHRDSSL